MMKDHQDKALPLYCHSLLIYFNIYYLVWQNLINRFFYFYLHISIYIGFSSSIKMSLYHSNYWFWWNKANEVRDTLSALKKLQLPTFHFLILINYLRKIWIYNIFCVLVVVFFCWGLTPIVTIGKENFPV